MPTAETIMVKHPLKASASRSPARMGRACLPSDVVPTYVSCVYEMIKLCIAIYD